MTKPQCWQHCAICGAPTQDAVVGNRLLSHWTVQHLPAESAPAVSWRCQQHRGYKMRTASAVWANEQGDLCFTLVCGHQAHWVFRGQWGYTPAMVMRGLETGQMRLDQRQRCYQCADLARESERQM